MNYAIQTIVTRGLLAFGLLVGLYWTSAAQADLGIFIGANAGYSDVEWDELKDDSSSQAYIGYNFTDWIGIEIGATKFGTFDVEHGNSSIEVDATHLTIDLIGDFAIPGLDVFAKIGVYDAKVERTCSNCASSNDISNTGITYAAGFSKSIHSSTAITLSWQNYYKVEDTELNLYQIGFKLQF